MEIVEACAVPRAVDEGVQFRTTARPPRVTYLHAVRQDHAGLPTGRLHTLRIDAPGRDEVVVSAVASDQRVEGVAPPRLKVGAEANQTMPAEASAGCRSLVEVSDPEVAAGCDQDMLDSIAAASAADPGALGVPHLRALGRTPGAGVDEQHLAVGERLDEIGLTCAAEDYRA